MLCYALIEHQEVVSEMGFLFFTPRSYSGLTCLCLGVWCCVRKVGRSWAEFGNLRSPCAINPPLLEGSLEHQRFEISR